MISVKNTSDRTYSFSSKRAWKKTSYLTSKIMALMTYFFTPFLTRKIRISRLTFFNLHLNIQWFVSLSWKKFKFTEKQLNFLRFFSFLQNCNCKKLQLSKTWDFFCSYLIKCFRNNLKRNLIIFAWQFSYMSMNVKFEYQYLLSVWIEHK